ITEELNSSDIILFLINYYTEDNAVALIFVKFGIIVIVTLVIVEILNQILNKKIKIIIYMFTSSYWLVCVE
ncbi:MAG: hypothetical protein ACTSPM_07660, partial [Candidatus Heimdallarchaeota archaeon]